MDSKSEELRRPDDPVSTASQRERFDDSFAEVMFSGDERYEIHGRLGRHRTTENYFTPTWRHAKT
ncbi:hypothetical protein OK015_10400 [Mycobacterium sp. Aquia_216]|uniref:hypothetical protein n=1 Tax=Mycobacterium sp. Aquia_216 TaxID=2991729 RepID=UPI00227A00B7|nr:hypothetical protein [Mycobacterium sp. Aquia_216]WAJ47941.1 hypothetical protein OK015_10400 [Mycobacterium sp. Aquia_216]